MTSQEETSLQRSGPEQGSQVAVTGTELDYPSIGGVLSGLSPPASLPRVGTATQDKEDLFQSLQEFVRTALLGGSPELRAGHIKSLDDVRPVLDDLWMSNTEYIARIVESLANGSRDRELLSLP